MNIIRLLLMSGIWVALLPYLGFPSFLKNILFFITGLFLIYISFLLKKRYFNTKRESFENFSENNDFSKE